MGLSRCRFASAHLQRDPAGILAALDSPTVTEAARTFPGGLPSIAMGMRLAGPARTVPCLPRDNLALHLDSGPFGEIMTLACLKRGVARLLIDGAIPDSAEIVVLGFPGFARGINIRGASEHEFGEADAVIVPPPAEARARSRPPKRVRHGKAR